MLLLLQIFNTFLHSSRQSVCLSGSFSLCLRSSALCSRVEQSPERDGEEMHENCTFSFSSSIEWSGMNRAAAGEERRCQVRATEKTIRCCTRRSLWGRQEFFSTYLGSALPLALSPSFSRFVRRYMSWLLCPRGGFSIPDDANSGAKTSEHKFFSTK